MDNKVMAEKLRKLRGAACRRRICGNGNSYKGICEMAIGYGDCEEEWS